ncbi:hypothetical protein [Wocania ichthyoenteri]|uniref:hypothetical protein n=1 Tax=Wocania ichthyoenteri TaxID=1230531 RepID=UPI00053DB911|nr:hypothetical protein [Wocania ichthyoenteri]
MKNLTLCIIALIFITSYSCKKNEKEIEQDYLESIIDKMDINDNIKWVIVLPGLGCHGCIQEAEAFMKEHIENKDILFVLTKIESFKILQNKLEIKIKDYKNIHIDKKHEISFPTDNGVYPCIIELDNGKIKSYEFQSPNNSYAFGKLESKI